MFEIDANAVMGVDLARILIHLARILIQICSKLRFFVDQSCLVNAPICHIDMRLCKGACARAKTYWIKILAAKYPIPKYLLYQSISEWFARCRDMLCCGVYISDPTLCQHMLRAEVCIEQEFSMNIILSESAEAIGG